MRRARSSGATCLVAFVTQLNLTTDRLSTICEFVGRVWAEVEITKTKEKYCGFLSVELKNARRE